MKKLNDSKILFVVNVDWFFLSHRLPIALELLEQGCEVHIATTITDKLSELESYGFIVHPVSLERSSEGVFSLFSYFNDLKRVFKRVQPDLVHLVTIKPVLIGGIAARVLKVPALVSAISGLGFVFVGKGFLSVIRRFFVSFLYRRALGHKNFTVIFQNNSDKACISNITGLLENDMELIPGSGVDLEEYAVKSRSEEAPVVMLAARLLADKGVREFVAAARFLKSNSSVNSRFVLVGDIDVDNPASITHEELTQWQSEGVIEFWGYHTDMPFILSKASIVVLPSYYGEGLPKVLIEAAACGRPVITTDHPGCRDAIEANITGLLVPIKDKVSLADSISKLLNDPALCVRMGLKGRELAEKRFSVAYVVDRHIDIYNRLLAKVDI